jgi:hypothetical protein
MTTHLRTAAAVTVGVFVALLLGYLGLVVFLLATIGIPLGAQPEPLTASGYAVLLVLAGGAATVGGRAAARIARERRRVAVSAVCAIVAMVMLWGFSGRNSWPERWGLAAAAVMAVGAYIGGSVWQRRSMPSGTRSA